MFFKSIRFKITILYMAILAVTLTSFSIILYHNVGNGLYGSMDTLLKSKAGGISQAINTYWEAYNLEAGSTSDKTETLRKRRNINFAKIAQRWVKEETTDPQLLDILVQVFDTDGAIIASSKRAQKLTDISRKNFISVLQGRNRFDTVASEEQTGRITLRIYTTPVFENEKVAYIVQVASPLSSIEVALNNIKIAVFILFPITVLLAGLMGVFLAKVTLRPVDNMINTIHQITAENMKLKLSVPDTKDEIQKLAETFNNMLGRLDEAFTSQRQLFEDLSHELKTPLTILKGEFEVILKKMRSQEEYQIILKSALEEINRITSLVQGLLLIAHLDSKEAVPIKNKIDLTALLKDVIDNIDCLAKLKNIEISFEPDGELLFDGDGSQLKTLFLNILDNAIKYTPQSGSIKVSAIKLKENAEIKVVDTGVGMSQEDIKHIFDRFYRIDKSRAGSGFGLGLSIAKSITEAHGGVIEVQSEPSVGTSFKVTLPLSAKSIY